MEFMNYTSGYYHAPLTIYSITPPYNNPYDQALSNFGLAVEPTTMLFLDRTRTTDDYLDRYDRLPINNNSNDIDHSKYLPSPPLSCSSLSPPIIDNLSTDYSSSFGVSGYFENANTSVSVSANGGDGFNKNELSKFNITQAQPRKSVITKIVTDQQSIVMRKNSSTSNGSDADEEFICKWDSCYRIFNTLESLATHVTSTHAAASEDGLFFCKWHLCPRSERGFNARYKMLVHIRTHTKEKPHQCTLCSKSFSRAENLKIHMRSHSGEKPYICSVEGCTKAYSNSSDRFKHTRTHAIEKPYFCKINGCNKRYTDPSSLRKHVKTFKHNNLIDLSITNSEMKTNEDNMLSISENNANIYQDLVYRYNKDVKRYKPTNCSESDTSCQMIQDNGNEKNSDVGFSNSEVFRLGSLFNDVSIVSPPPKKSKFWREKYLLDLNEPLDLSIHKS